MKIAQITLRYPPATGGVENHVKNITTGLIKKGHEVKVFTSDLAQHHPPIKLRDDLLKNDPSFVFRHRTYTPPFFAYPILQGLKKSLLQESFDLFHAHGFWYFPADLAAKISKISKTPLVFNPYYYENKIRNKWRWRIYKKLIGQKVFQQSRKIIIISPWEEKLIKKANLAKNKFYLIPPGVYLEEFKEKRGNYFRKLGLNNKIIILFVGRICQSKGLDLLIKAAPHVLKKIPNAVFVCVGEDFGEKENFIALTKKLGITKNFIWPGKVSRNDLLSCYQHAHLFVLPSRYEAFGIVLIEAQAAGLPIVATRDTAIPDVVPENQAGLLFEKENFKDLSKKIVQLLLNKNLQNKFRATGIKLVAEKYQWKDIIDKLERVYLEVIKYQKLNIKNQKHKLKN